ncbi:MAG: cytochrome c3 family protein, partial [Thermoanaerobaculales bacterium]
FGIDCSSCHTGHNSAGGNLTTSAGNVNLCQSCHNPAGLASALPINSSDVAQPGSTGSSHGFDAAVTNAAFGALPPTHQEMLLRVMSGNVVCSTCHDQHAASSANRGRTRVSPPDQLTSLGSTGQVTVGGQYTGTGGSSYLLEITVADSRFRYSKDGGTSWLAEQNIGAGVPLDNGLTVTFSGGSFAIAERWRFSASFPFLRAALDEGANSVGDKYCRDCHRDWTMDHVAVETYDGSFKSHPVGQALGANGRGYDRPVPLDGNGGEQGVNGDLNQSNDFRLDAGGLVQCISCHGVHYADSNTLTEDGP